MGKQFNNGNTRSRDLTKPLKPLVRMTKSEWLRLSQSDQLRLYNTCVDNCDELLERIKRVAILIREERNLCSEDK